MRDIYVSNSAITAVPGGSATVVLWDSTADPGKGTTLARRRSFSMVRRAIVCIRTDQVATFQYNILNAQSTTWRTINGSGSGQSVLASTDMEFDVLFIGEDNQLVVVTGTAPAVWQVSVRLVEGDRGLGQ